MFFTYPNAASEAELAGFRSCKRCRPDRSAGDQTVIAVGECVKHMMMAAFTSAQEGGEPKKRTLKDYAARAGLSTFHFHRESDPTVGLYCDTELNFLFLSFS